MKPRPKKPAPKSNTPTTNTETSATTKPQSLPPSTTNPPHLFILPKTLSPNARIITLPSPATGIPSRYIIDPENRQCYEFTRISTPKRACRSLLLAPHVDSLTNNDGETAETADGRRRNDRKDTEGYVLEKAEVMVATPVDPVFLILPALAQDIPASGEQKGRQMYLAASDYLDRLSEQSKHMAELISSSQTLESLFENRMRSVCDMMDLGEGEETLYRLSMTKLIGMLVEKARKVVEKGLFPASMQDKFVKQELAVPVLNVRREESGISLVDEDQLNAEGKAEDEVDNTSESTSQNTQSSTSTSAAMSTSTAATSPSPQSQTTQSQSQSQSQQPTSNNPNEEKEEEISHLLRLRTTLTYLLTTYIPVPLHLPLQHLLTNPSTSPIDFTPLDTQLAHLAKLKQEAQTLRSLSDNISRKRSADEDDAEVLEKAEAKKRRKEEEEVRKRNVSRGVKQLAKADRSGMRALSAFFGKRGG